MALNEGALEVVAAHEGAEHVRMAMGSKLVATIAIKQAVFTDTDYFET